MSEPLRLIVEPTPDPNALTLTLNRTLVLSGSETYRTPAEAQASPVAKQLFTTPGVKSLVFSDNVVTVGREPGHRWEEIIPKVKAVLDQYFAPSGLA